MTLRAGKQSERRTWHHTLPSFRRPGTQRSACAFSTPGRGWGAPPTCREDSLPLYSWSSAQHALPGLQGLLAPPVGVSQLEGHQDRLLISSDHRRHWGGLPGRVWNQIRRAPHPRRQGGPALLRCIKNTFGPREVILCRVPSQWL